jgi:hypothetical protein
MGDSSVPISFPVIGYDHTARSSASKRFCALLIAALVRHFRPRCGAVSIVEGGSCG